MNGQKERGLTKEKMERPTHMKVEQHCCQYDDDDDDDVDARRSIVLIGCSATQTARLKELRKLSSLFWDVTRRR